MKKILALIVLAVVVFLLLNRQRVFLWDPIATISRDGLKVEGARAMINYSNDVLLEDGSAGKKRLYLVQQWNKVVGAPSVPLRCLQFLGCMTDRDQASAAPIAPGTRGNRAPFEGVTMTSRLVEFVDEDGALVTVQLR